MSLRIRVGDVETTGLDGDARIIELAQVEIDTNFNVICEQDSLIDPEISIPHHVSGITGIVDKDVEDSPTIEEFVEQLSDGWFDGETVLVAHNARFDERFFGPLYDNMVSVVCTLRLARKVYPDLVNHQLATLKYALDLPKHEGHRALNDVLVTVDLLKRIAHDTDCSLEDLIDLSAKPIRVGVMPFGKHKGAPIEAIPPGYRSWLLNSCDNLDPDLEWSLKNPVIK